MKLEHEVGQIVPEDIPDFKPLLGCLLVMVLLAMLLGLSALGAYCGRYSKKGPQIEMLRKSVDDWNAWRKQNPVRAGDLSGSDLSGMVLTSGYFSGTSFSKNGNGSNLARTLLRKADLTEANVAHSVLTDADLDGAILRKTTLSYSKLSGVSLRHVDAREASFVESDLSGADLTGTNLVGANFYNANLSGVRLADADLTGANLRSANLVGVIGWEAIKSLHCANIYGIQIDYDLEVWALDHGALTFDYGYLEREWLKLRNECLQISGLKFDSAAERETLD